MLGWLARGAWPPADAGFTQDDIDAAVTRSLSTTTLPSQAARAYEVIRPSVVLVQAVPEPGQTDGKGTPRAAARPDRAGPGEPGSVGTGVVIVDKGLILTNLHVVAGARRIRITFADGFESEATMVGAQPENDLAVLQARSIPDDLVAAAMRSSADLAVGDLVVAVGFPFGIGPSASAGVVSGLKRDYRSPEGQRTIGNLIQFDAAANPGNSGGPLVTAEGEVVGIVTGILSPGSQRFFIGIGFAVPIESAASAAGIAPF
jgi:S1-C subfamily serine protease